MSIKHLTKDELTKLFLTKVKKKNLFFLLFTNENKLYGV